MWAAADVAAARRQPRALRERAHRPWPVPDRPWVMGQTWEDVLFAHWRVDEEALRQVVPSELPLDTFDGSAWVAVTPLVVSGLRVRYAPPIPGTARFPEVNLRTYATVGGRPGVYFLSLDAANRLAVEAARRLYRVPYFRAAMDVARERQRVRFRSERVERYAAPAAIDVEYAPAGPVFTAPRPSFEYWAIERYCLYTIDERHRVLRGEIHHPPWPLQPAEASFARNTLALPFGIDLEGDPVLHFAQVQDTVFWLLGPA